MTEPGRPPALDPSLPATSAAPRDLPGLLEALRASAAQRDREGGHAAQEKQWIAEAGLLTLAVPREFGGAGAPWPRSTKRSVRWRGSTARSLTCWAFSACRW